MIVLGIVTHAQSYNPDRIKPKALDQYDQAVEYLKAGEIKEAIPVLQNCIVIDSNYVDAYLSLAAAYGQLKQYAASIKLYEKPGQKTVFILKFINYPIASIWLVQGAFKKH